MENDVCTSGKLETKKIFTSLETPGISAPNTQIQELIPHANSQITRPATSPLIYSARIGAARIALITQCVWTKGPLLNGAENYSLSKGSV